MRRTVKEPSEERFEPIDIRQRLYGIEAADTLAMTALKLDSTTGHWNAATPSDIVDVVTSYLDANVIMLRLAPGQQSGSEWKVKATVETDAATPQLLIETLHVIVAEE